MVKRGPSSAITALAGAACCVAIAFAGNPAPRLSPAEQKSVTMTCQAYYQGNPVGVLQALSPLVGKVNEAKLSLVDQSLSARQLPTSARLLADARLVVAQQGLEKRAPRPEAREIKLVLPPIREQIGAILSLAEKDAVMADQFDCPDDLEKLDRLAWNMHVLKNRLYIAKRMAEYAGSLAKVFPRPLLEKMKESDQEAVTTDYTTLASDTDRMIAELEQREAEMRIHRLAVARQVLERPELTGERIVSAWAADLDSSMLASFFEQSERKGRSFTRPVLLQADIANRVAADAKRASGLAGDLAPKARLLFEGIYWWSRGRYGLGSDVEGLAKSPAAMRSPEAQFTLQMPAATPKPTDPAGRISAEPVPRFERRHHYLWAWEDRRLLRFAPRIISTETKALNGDRTLFRIDSFT